MINVILLIIIYNPNSNISILPQNTDTEQIQPQNNVVLICDCSVILLWRVAGMMEL